MYKKKDIDIWAHIYYLLAKCLNKKKTRMILPFLGLILSILHQERVKIPSSLPVMKREDPIFALTMTRRAKLVFVVLKRKKEHQVRTLLMKVATLMMRLTTSPLDQNIWMPHLLRPNPRSSDRLSFRCSHKH